MLDSVEGFPIDKAGYNALTTAEKKTFTDKMTSFYDRPSPSSQDLAYEVRNFRYHLEAIFMDEQYYKKLVSKATSAGGIKIFFDTFHHNRLNNEGSKFMFRNLTEQYQNLRQVWMASLNMTKERDPTTHCFSTFYPYIANFRFRVGARSWQTVDNTKTNQALSFTNTLLSCNLLTKHKSNTVSWSQWHRSKNVHCFTFDKIPDDSIFSGQNTTDGKTLRLEVEFANQPEEKLTLGANDYVLKKAIDYREAVIYLFCRVTSLLEISNRGVSVTY